MNKKGFTLIELLAVIVVLSLIVVIGSVSVVKVVKDSKDKLYNSQVKLIEKAAKLWASSNINKLPTDEECVYLTIGELKNFGLLDSSIKNPKTNLEFSDDIKIKISSIKTNINSVLNYEFDARDISDCTTISSHKCSLVIDENNNKEADTGDMITCLTESFYVIENDETTISMLAKYNLDVGNNISNPTGIQKENTEGRVTFSNIRYWDDDSYINADEEVYPFVYNNNSNLYMYLEDYEKYLIEKGVTSASATLINHEQLVENLGLVDECGGECTARYDWVFTTNYWTGFWEYGNIAFVEGYNDYVCSDVYNYSDMLGVRPVINILANELN